MAVVRCSHRSRLSLILTLGVVLQAGLAGAQSHQEGRPQTGGTPKATQGAPAAPTGLRTGEVVPSLNDTAALGTFIDGVMKAHIEEMHIPAAVIVVLQNGRVLYAKGYGDVDIAKQVPVDPATSLFRIGSISKLFTWTAVMQLVEQGKLNLDTDVNTYLKTFKIPATFPQPVTLRSVMTHSPGFEDGALGYLIISDSSRVEPIATTLDKHMPARVRPPLELSSYSNYGAALAGLIVEQVSGIPFNEYVQRNILDPLDMHHATFQEPLPPALRPDGVVAYGRQNGVYAAKPFEFVGGFRPAGSVSASALDMTHFMIAHLQNGRYGSTQILRPETAELMHRSAFANDPRLPPMDLGFYDQRFNGHRVFGHEGDTQYFHSAMFLMPDEQVGIFMSYDGVGSPPARSGMLRAFFDRYFPAPPPPPVLDPPADTALATLQQYAGSYRFARHSSTKLEKALLLAEGTIDVAPLPGKGRLVVSGLDKTPDEYAAIAKGLFHEVEGHRTIGFHVDTMAHVMRLSADDLPFMGTEPVPWNERPSLWFTVLGVSVLLFLTMFTTLFYRWREIRGMPSAQRRTMWLAVATAGWFLLTIIVMGAVIAAGASRFFSEIPTSFRVSLIMPIVFVLLTIALVVAIVPMWRRGYWSRGRRVHLTLVAMSAVAICLFFNTWNLLGWRFG